MSRPGGLRRLLDAWPHYLLASTDQNSAHVSHQAHLARRDTNVVECNGRLKIQQQQNILYRVISRKGERADSPRCLEEIWVPIMRPDTIGLHIDLSATAHHGLQAGTGSTQAVMGTERNAYERRRVHEYAKSGHPHGVSTQCDIGLLLTATLNENHRDSPSEIWTYAR